MQLLHEGDPAAKASAARALWSLAANDAGNQMRIAQAGGIAPLVQVLRLGEPQGRASAARALWNLASHEDDGLKHSIADAGAIAPLVDLLHHGGEQDRATAAGALSNLAVNDELEAVIHREHGFTYEQLSAVGQTGADDGAACEARSR